ncbi:MAG: hypothetical protein DCC67_17020 [Planctomycetota bacterium]|nr:MAG: hypothetical protein DCC67_17020 [Planctomycetota bacterium]
MCVRLGAGGLAIVAAVMFVPRSAGQGVDTAISAAALAKDILKDISDKLKGDVSARTDAQAESIGVDADDLGVRAAADEFDGPFGLEWELEAWTTLETGGTELGPNAGDAHSGYAQMTVEWKDGAWVVAKKDNGDPRREAFAWAKKDTTPVAGSTNPTAAAAVATFSVNGAIRDGWTIKDADAPAAVGQAPLGHESMQNVKLEPADGVDVTGLSTAAYVWRLDEFQIQDVVVEGETLAEVTPPQAEVVIGHSFLQLEASSDFRRRYVSSGGASPLVDSIVALQNAAADASHGTQDLSNAADLTVAGGRIPLAPASIPRGALSDREVIEQYLLSRTVVPPEHAQAGYAPNVTLYALLGGSHGFSPSSELGLEGGFADASEFSALNGVADFNLADMVGLTVEITGSLTDAMNLAYQTPGHAIQPFFAGTQVNDTVALDMTFTSSEEVYANSEETITIDEPAQYWVGDIGSWDDPAGWTPRPFPPTLADHAVINKDSARVVVPATAQAQSATVIAGQLDVAPLAALMAPTTVHALGTLTGGGTVIGNVTNSGLVDPVPTTRLTIVGNYVQQPGGVLSLQIGGQPTAPWVEMLVVQGHVALTGGELQLTFVPGFMPMPGQVFDVLDFASLSGGFALVKLPDRFYWNTSNLLLDGTVMVEAPVIPGDYDRDRDVDGADLLAWQQQLGLATGAFSGADGDGNGVVDAGDLAVWQSGFGLGVTAASVPEPAAAGLAAAVFWALAARRRTDVR